MILVGTIHVGARPDRRGTIAKATRSHRWRFADGPNSNSTGCGVDQVS
jgi:hypothetical protein